MTKNKFYKENGVFTGFVSKGHSGYSPQGEDIVCASISSALYMTANTVTEIYKLPADLKVEDGYFSMKLDEVYARKCNELFEGLYLHLKELETLYPDFITNEIIED